MAAPKFLFGARGFRVSTQGDAVTFGRGREGAANVLDCQRTWCSPDSSAVSRCRSPAESSRATVSLGLPSGADPDIAAAGSDVALSAALSPRGKPLRSTTRLRSSRTRR